MEKRLFLVDDDADDREFFCEAVQGIAPDCICMTAPNGRRALNDLQTIFPNLPDIIFLDINMPMMNGWQCLLMLKSLDIYRQIPVIMYSTSSHTEDVQKAHELGALCLFTKPPNFKDLQNSLALIVGHLQNNTLSGLVLSSSLFLVPEELT